MAVGSDHAGFRLKSELVRRLTDTGRRVTDVGTDSDAPVDYPGFCAAVGRLVAAGAADRGIVLGGSGQGEQIAANKIAGVRAALGNDLHTAVLSRRHNDANVLALGARIVAPELALEIVERWLTTSFDGGRHRRRIDQISRLERRSGPGRAPDRPSP